MDIISYFIPLLQEVFEACAPVAFLIWALRLAITFVLDAAEGRMYNRKGGF